MKLRICDEKLRIDLESLEKILAVKRPFEIPLKHILQATTEAPKTSWREIRAPGTHFPGAIKAGTYYSRRGKEFWYVTRGKGFLVIELKDEPYKRIILGIERNKQWAQRINEALSKLHLKNQEELDKTPRLGN